MLTVVLGLSAVASAGDSDNTDGSYVGSSTTTSVAPAVDNAQVQQASAASDSNEAEKLAYTGGDATRLAAIAGLLVVTGAGIILVQRKRANAS